MKKRKLSRKGDFISDLPQSIVETILTTLPIRDAVRTSILSTKWKYQWANITQLARIDQCLRFLSRKEDLKELDLNGGGQILPTPSPIFSCQQITSLTLSGFVLQPPRKFRGFPCLKCLNLNCCTVTLKVIENLISGCPLLESLEVSNDDHLALTVNAPNLKYLAVDGTFKDLYLEHTPLLASISINFFSSAWQGDVFVKLPITYNYLKFIEVTDVNYKEMNEVLYVHHLLLKSPNLQELQISAASIEEAPFNAADLDLWDKKWPTNFKFKHLKIVKMWYVSNEYDMNFIKFVLGRSPVLQAMSISLDEDCIGTMNMVNRVLHFRRASAKVDINFFD